MIFESNASTFGRRPPNGEILVEPGSPVDQPPNKRAVRIQCNKRESNAVSENQEAKSGLNQLEQIKKFTKIVADTGDFESIREFKPQDATTNPSLIYAATQKEQYVHLLDEVIVDRKKSGLTGAAQIDDIIEHLLAKFGSEFLKIVPGRVSTETDARYSFDAEGAMKKARRLIELYDKQGIGRERILIKIASTWEGILAAEQLQKEGIKCNMTLLFSLVQAAPGRRG